jgi:peroxiredoxin Q/BCP
MADMLTAGDAAPAFSLPDQEGKTRTLSEFSGEWILLYFYPKDATPGCTTEACELRDNYVAFKNANCQVIGVSADSVESHDKFARKEKLYFVLLADTEKKTINDYGVWQMKHFLGKDYMGIVRMSFLIDPKGVIRKIYPKVSPEEHAGEVLGDLKSMA